MVLINLGYRVGESGLISYTYEINFLLMVNQNICCDPSLELSRRDGSNEGAHHLFSLSKKNIPGLLSDD